jgi:tRNA threonylcarbamoyladenosine biosynthesis protein TsaE
MVPSFVHLECEDDTESLGQRLANGLEPGILINLLGDLGSGKTTFVRGLLRGLGFYGRVRSPTFAIVEPYEQSRLFLYHFDFYRLNGSRELLDSGLLEMFGTDAVCVVEWPEKASGILPKADMDIFFHIDRTGGRIASLDANTSRGKRCLKAAFA